MKPIALGSLICCLLIQWPLFARAVAEEPVCIIKANVNLRKGPSAKSAVSWAVPKYMPLMKLEKKGSWLKVQDLDGQVHWVRSKMTSARVNCAVVKTKTAKLREKPSASSPLADLSQVNKYTAFLRTDRDGEWLQIKDDFGGSFWIHETNVWLPTIRAKVSF